MLTECTILGRPPHENLRFRPYSSYPQSVRDSNSRLFSARLERERRAAREDFVRRVLEAVGLPVVEDEVPALALVPEELYLEHLEALTAHPSGRHLALAVPDRSRFRELLMADGSRPLAELAEDASASVREVGAALLAAEAAGLDPTSPLLVGLWSRVSRALLIPLAQDGNGYDQWVLDLNRTYRTTQQAA